MDSGIFAMSTILPDTRGRDSVAARRGGSRVEEKVSMVMSSAFTVDLSAADEAVQAARAVQPRASYRDVLRARIVLAAAQGKPNAVIGRRDEHPWTPCARGANATPPTG